MLANACGGPRRYSPPRRLRHRGRPRTSRPLARRVFDALSRQNRSASIGESARRPAKAVSERGGDQPPAQAHHAPAGNSPKSASRRESTACRPALAVGEIVGRVREAQAAEGAAKGDEARSSKLAGSIKDKKAALQKRNVHLHAFYSIGA